MSGDSRADADELAALEREQRFLLQSLDDLDAEHVAGDLDSTDHQALTDDYTRRLAEVTRAIDDGRQAFVDARPAVTTSRRVLTVCALVAVAIVAGVLLARASGFRSPSDSVTGDIRQSSAGLLAEADTLTREGRWEEALTVYDDALDVSPANTEALTYSGWIRAQLGEPKVGLDTIDEAIAIDPTYPDARVFRAILLDREQRFAEAADELAVLDDLEVPDDMLSLVDGSGLRSSVIGGQLVQQFGTPGTPIDLAAVNGDLDAVTDAGLVLVELDPELAVRTFTAVLDVDPDNVTALVAKGNLLGTSEAFLAVPEVAAEGLALLDRAVELRPDASDIRLFRAFARNLQGEPGVQDDLAVIDPTSLAVELRPIYDQLAG